MCFGFHHGERITDANVRAGELPRTSNCNASRPLDLIADPEVTSGLSRLIAIVSRFPPHTG